MTTTTDVNVTSSIWPILGLLLDTNSCPCLNGGTCRKIDEHNTVCQCPKSFEGVRCETTELGFIVSGNNNNHINSDFIAGIAVASLMVLVLIAVGFMVFRRCVRLREKRRWVKWQESRSQSKATIEGFTIVEPTPTLGGRKGKLGLFLFKNINHKNIFSLGRSNNPELPKQSSDDVESGIAYSERNDSLPALDSSDSQTSSVVASERAARHSQISVLSKQSDITFVSTPISRKSSVDKLPRGLQTRRATVRGSCPQHSRCTMENNKFDLTCNAITPAKPTKVYRYSLPNLNNTTRPTHVPVRTRKLSFAPTLNEVIHI
uniref:Uncharacterized protein LOC108951066 n=1 Tax=Phallusia mammillata TaxID=59560 RepID=A0A6F9DIV1_9ASCI|nr:uncharacterized protein LOC108951066 [Phallusia mammillata]